MIIGVSTATKRDQARKAARFTGGYATEIAIFMAAFFLFWMTSSLPFWVWIPMLGSLVGLVVWQREKVLPRAKEMQSSAKVKRKLIAAAAKCGFQDLKAKKVIHTLPGEWVDVVLPAGSTINDLEKRADAMAGVLKAEDVHVIKGAHRGVASVSIIRRDAFETMGPIPWPLMDAERVNIREPIPFGVNQYGREYKARLLSRNVILGGAPDAGKSTTLRVFTAAAVLDPMAKVWMMDAKTGGAEFIHWTAAAERVVRGRDLESALELLAALEERVTARSHEIVARGEVFVQDDMEIDVLFIDELPQFTRGFEKDSKGEQSMVKSIREGIWRLIALGRWAGMITVLSAQKPTVDIVPSESRDLVDHKFALHCNTPAQLKSIIGDHDDETTIRVSDVPSGIPGLGHYIGDHGPEKIRSYFISHKQALEIASRVASRKIDQELAREFSPSSPS